MLNTQCKKELGFLNGNEYETGCIYRILTWGLLFLSHSFLGGLCWGVDVRHGDRVERTGADCTVKLRKEESRP